jgi:hypothetical protein
MPARFMRYGIHNFEFLDRRLIGNNQWRNTANTFQGFHATLGQEATTGRSISSPCSRLNRSIYEWDRPVEQQWVYAVIGHWRGWGEIITLEPYYLALSQSPTPAWPSAGAFIPACVATASHRGTGFDYDAELQLPVRP